MNQKLSQEEQIVVKLARRNIEEHEIKEIEFGAVAWKRVFKIAKEQDVYTIVYHNAKVHGLLSLNTEQKDSYVQYRTLHKKICTIEMEKIKGELRKTHTYVLCLKGYALDKKMYQGLRDYWDIDIAVDEKNFRGLLNILTKLGYIPEPRQELISELNDSFLHASEMIGELKKTVAGVDIWLDIHKIVKNSPEHLDCIYNYADKTDYLCFPSQYDCCIFLCYHAWRHYPHPYRMIEYANVMKLKNLMDIRESYLEIAKNGKELEFFQYADSIHSINVVNEMLYLAERIYGAFVAIQFKYTFSNKVKHDYYDGKISSFFEERLFYKEEEREKTLLLCEKHMNMLKAGRNMPCNKAIEGADCTALSRLSTNIYTMTCGYWNDVFGGHSFSITPRNARIGLYWNLRFFINIIEVEDMNYHFGNDCYYDETQDCLILAFTSQNVTLHILPKSNDQHKVYRIWNDKKVPLEVTDCYLYSKVYSDSYKIILLIPWSLLKINPELQKEFTLNINIKVGEATDLGKDILMPFGYSTSVQIE